MAEINLLKQSAPKTSLVEYLPSFLTKFFVGVLLALVVYYGWVYVQGRSVAAETEKVQSEIAKEQQAISQKPRRDELITRQGQLSELERILEAHQLWSRLLPELGRVTLKTATYSTIKALSDGTMSVTVTVPSTADLDKFLQVFDDPRLSQNFSNLKVGSVTSVQKGGVLVTSFDVRMKFNPGLLK